MSILDIVKLRGANRNNKIKIVLTAICLASYQYHIGFYEGCPIFNRLAYSFCHANVWHLAVNLFVLWSIQGKLYIIAPLAIAVYSSLLPMYVTAPTMGLSGFLFAWFGIAWGKALKPWSGFIAVLPYLCITMLISNVNGLLHLYAFLIGLILSYIYFKCCYLIKTRKL